MLSKSMGMFLGHVSVLGRSKGVPYIPTPWSDKLLSKRLPYTGIQVTVHLACLGSALYLSKEHVHVARHDHSRPFTNTHGNQSLHDHDKAHFQEIPIVQFLASFLTVVVALFSSWN